MPTNLTLYSIKALIVLEASNGSRVLSKYYPIPAGFGPMSQSTASTHFDKMAIKDQKVFEKKLWDKTRKSLLSEIIMFENHIVVYKSVSDLIIYIVGSLDENEVMLSGVLNTVYESIQLVLLKYQTTEKRTVVEYMDLVALTIDECIDQGVILETDPGIIAARVSKRPSEMADVSLGDPQSISNAISKAKDQFFAGVLLK